MRAPENPTGDAIHVATCNDREWATLFAAAPVLLHALDCLSASPNDPRAHRRALDAMAAARGEVVKDSGLDAVVASPSVIASGILPACQQCISVQRAVLVLVVNASGGLVSLEVSWNDRLEEVRARLEVARAIPGWRVLEIPLSAVLALASVVRTGPASALPWAVVPSTAGGGTARCDIVSHGGPFSPSFVAGDMLPGDAAFIVAASVLLGGQKDASGAVSVQSVGVLDVERKEKARKMALVELDHALTWAEMSQDVRNRLTRCVNILQGATES